MRLHTCTRLPAPQAHQSEPLNGTGVLIHPLVAARGEDDGRVKWGYRQVERWVREAVRGWRNRAKQRGKGMHERRIRAEAEEASAEGMQTQVAPLPLGPDIHNRYSKLQGTHCPAAHVDCVRARTPSLA